MDYNSYFGFNIAPFASSPDERFYYNSPFHSKALIKLLHVVEQRRGLAVLIGDIGTGKTMISRKLLDYFSSQSDIFEVSLLVIIHSEITAGWLLKRIAVQLGAKVETDNKIDIIGYVYKQLSHLKEKKKRPVVMIDEANMLRSKEIMEELRGLLNIVDSDGHLITFLLFGMPETEENLKLDPPLYERISVKVTLTPMDLESTLGYIKHRIKIAGREESLFSEDALKLIHQISKGKPRLINNICDNALLEAFIEKRKFIEVDIIKQISQDIGIIS